MRLHALRFARPVIAAGVLWSALLLVGCPSNSGGGNNNPPADADGDGVADTADLCADTPAGADVDASGCPDTDGDGVRDNTDLCAGTAAGVAVDETGCPEVGPGPSDADDDGVADDDDDCPNTPAGAEVDANGCPDTDNDGVRDNLDLCAGTPAGLAVDDTGCPEDVPLPDADDDGVPDADDDCPNTLPGQPVDARGCPETTPSNDNDGDGVLNDVDVCADTPATVTVDAVGCPVSQGGPDTDEDGVNDDIDQCPASPAGAAVNANGCPDTDGDGVFDDVDECSATPTGAAVNANGCPDTDGDGVFDDTDECPGSAPRDPVDAVGCPIDDGGGPAVCGDGTVQSGEECDDGNTTAGDGCDATCDVEPGVCGDGTLNSGEQCDDGNTAAGDGCDASCQVEAGSVPNDACANPGSVTDATISFSNTGATTDAIADSGPCAAEFDMLNDIWFCYRATCSGTATVSLCGSSYDTTLHVYSECTCPTTAALVCNDDGCGLSVDLRSSRNTFPAVAGASYMIRIGGFQGETGTGSLTIYCGPDAGRGLAACGTNANDCEADNSTPACADEDCCSTVCGLDPFCCDVEWDNVCGEEGTGICGSGFTACGADAGDCLDDHQTPGCDDVDLCQSICDDDPFCCLDSWDNICAETATTISGNLQACQTATGSCTAVGAAPGCSIEACCEMVCLIDNFCCTNGWDQNCVDLALENSSVCR